MLMSEKADLLKDTIYKLYSEEGRSKSYISRVLLIDRKTVTQKIREWNFPDPEPSKHVSPSTEKFINRNRSLIKARLDSNVSISEIARELGCNRGLLSKVVLKVDPVLKKAQEDYINRMKLNADLRRNTMKEQSRLKYDEPDMDGEVWDQILGYPDYEVSNMGRIRSWSKRPKAYYILRTTINGKSGREYVRLTAPSGEARNLQVARLVAFSFVEGHDDEHNTVNHEDGNVQNNRADNLTWMSLSENVLHSFYVLGRKTNRERRKFSKIIYKGKYEFKTITAFARFIGKSTTQAGRYLEEKERHDITLVL